MLGKKHKLTSFSSPQSLYKPRPRGESLPSLLKACLPDGPVLEKEGAGRELIDLWPEQVYRYLISPHTYRRYSEHLLITILATRLAHDPTNSLSAESKARLATDFSTGCTCVSHASDVLGVFVMVTLGMVVQRLNTRERNIPSLVQRGLIGGSLGRFGTI